ncbi:tetratricopeptide (TPR) repeat protein [Nocardioides thalensis]|uniref:Tetratricopeptide (TPR) repeat protein n=1 Tax=Nocardioides thalensis TaxID=1914755 RepID=A0A853C2G0_9ACTN|nr:hypothetical protein [Nocardioides thalensis]NYJ00533.1 tetratricopeptide (TPR) repeat protein [Nocardioides thalensis]
MAGSLPDPESPEALAERAEEAYRDGRMEAALTAWEQLYAVHVAAGRRSDAALAAALVALNLLCETGLMAPVRAWETRARQQLESEPTGPAHAILAITRTYERILSGDPEGAAAPAREAVELGTRLGVDPARGLGLVAAARLAIHAGEVDDAIDQLDRLAVALAAGEFDPLTTGNVYCELICVAQWLGRHDLARAWTEVMERWRHGTAYGATHGRCRVHRAELLRMSGPAAAAEAEAVAACDELRPWMRREYGWPLVELGNIRLRRGDLAGAEEAFLEANARAWCAQPGLALLRLAQGEAAEAAEMIRAELSHPTDVPWKERPPFGGLRAVPLLAAQAQVAEHLGDAATAATAAAELAAVHAAYPSDGLRATVRLAEARAALLAGDADRAIGVAREAAALWIDLDAPYDAALARTLTGDAQHRLGNADVARLEWQAARRGFEAFGAELAVQVVDQRLGVAAVRPDAAPAASGGVAELVRDGDHWLVRYDGRAVVLPDLKGIAYLARLLSAPSREHHVLDLAGAGAVAPGLPVLDDEAKASYRRRLAEVEADLAEAEADHDEARVRLAERDRDYLVAELTAAAGLGGRARTTGGTAERARTSVTRSLRYALARLSEVAPDLGAHLDRTVRTGTCCCYEPDPVARLEWKVTG